MKNSFKKPFRVFCLVLVACFVLGHATMMPAVATEDYYLKVRDIDLTLYTSSNIIITQDNRLFVSGHEMTGEFGNGGDPNDIFDEFTEIDISFIGSPVIDIISNMGETFLLTQAGTVYYAGNSSAPEPSFTQIDPAAFGNSPVVKAFRNVQFVVFLTQDQNIYISSFMPETYRRTVALVPRPEVDGVPVQVVQTMGLYGSYCFLLDTTGTVWLSMDIGNIIYNSENTLPISWAPVEAINGTTPKISRMTMIYYPLFLTTDGRIFYTGNYEFSGENQKLYSYIDPTNMDDTGISDVKEFVPFYAQSVFSEIPNFRKNDGKIYGGYNLYHTFVGPQEPEYPDRIVAATDFLPTADSAKILTIGQPVPQYASGSYVTQDGDLYAINNAYNASNGLLWDPENPLDPPYPKLQRMLYQGPRVIDPQAPTLVDAKDGNVNPTAILMPPKQVGDIPIQAKWVIKDASGSVVDSGISYETNQVATVFISLKQAPAQSQSISGQSLVTLDDGNYTLTFFRETTDAYEGTYMRSATEQSISFVINSKLGEGDGDEDGDDGKDDNDGDENPHTGDVLTLSALLTLLSFAGILSLCRARRQTNH